MLSVGVYGAPGRAYLAKRSVGKGQDMGLRVPSKNPLPGAQGVVNALVVLVHVTAGAIAGHKVPIRVTHLIGLREVRQKRLSRGVNAVSGYDVPGKGCSASRMS